MLLMHLERAQDAFSRGWIGTAELALAQFERELDKQTKSMLSAEVAAQLRTGVRALRAGTFPTTDGAIAERIGRILVVVRALAPWLTRLSAELESADYKLAAGDRRGALTDVHDAKAALATQGRGLWVWDAFALRRDLDALLVSLSGAKG